jgi:hypothetical protein
LPGRSWAGCCATSTAGLDLLDQRAGGLICGYLGWRMLKRFETKTSKLPIDRVGLILLVVWVAALQLMLDEGKERTGSPPPKSCCWR